MSPRTERPSSEQSAEPPNEIRAPDPLTRHHAGLDYYKYLYLYSVNTFDQSVIPHSRKKWDYSILLKTIGMSAITTYGDQM